MVSEIEFGGLVFVVNLPARWAHFILVLTGGRIPKDHRRITLEFTAENNL